MVLSKENASRKIDALGRVSIPKGLRDRLELNVNDEVEFYTLNVDGDMYVCLTNHKAKNSYAAAAQVLEDLGLEVPEKLAKLL